MVRSSKPLLFGAVAAGLLWAGLALGLGGQGASAVAPLERVGALRGAASGARAVEAPHRGAVRVGSIPERRREAAPPGGADARARAGSALEVRVLPRDVGELELVLCRGSVEWGRGVTRDGRIVFDGLAAGGYLLRAEGPSVGELVPELAPEEGWSDPSGTWRRIEVPGRGDAVALELAFVRSATLAGVVLDACGVPVAAAEVLVQDLLRPADTCRSAVDELGRFDVAGLRPSRYGVAVRFEDTGDAAADGRVALPRELALGPGESARLVLRAEEGRRTLRGQVVDRGGLPLEGLRMVCAVAGFGADTPRPAASRILARARTDVDGVFRFEGLPAAALCVSVDARELELGADGKPRRLRRGCAPLDVDPVGDALDLGVLLVEAPPERARNDEVPRASTSASLRARAERRR